MTTTEPSSSVFQGGACACLLSGVLVYSEACLEAAPKCSSGTALLPSSGSWSLSGVDILWEVLVISDR